MSRTVKVGMRGTKKWEKWMLQNVSDPDAKLIHIRYEDDKENHRKRILLTIQVQEKYWPFKKPNHTPSQKYLYLKVGKEEKDVQKEIKSYGGVWDYKKGGWRIKYQDVIDNDYELLNRRFDPDADEKGV